MITRTFHPHPFPETVSAVDFLLAEERAAAEAYARALKQLVLPRHPEPIRELFADHQLAARHLLEYAPTECPTTAGAWHGLAQVVDAGSRFHVREAVLWALHAAEGRSVREYEECLELDEVPDECKGLIRTELLPKARKHLHRLDALIRLAEDEVEL